LVNEAIGRPALGAKSDSAADEGRRAARQEQVLDAAVDLVRRRGFHAASMAELAKMAGMSVGHIYHYFENKEAIVAAIVARDLEQVMDMLEGFKARGGDLYDVMIDEVDRGYDDSRRIEETALFLEIYAEAARNPKVAKMVNDADAISRGKLRELMIAGRKAAEPWPPEDLDARVEIIIALFEGLRQRALLNHDVSREAMVRNLRSVVRQLLGDQGTL
jgi:AcrR family transcriptional regulator